MNNLTKILLTMLAMLCVIGYTIFNYIRGSIDTVYFLVCIAVVGLPFANMINILIQELKNR